MNRRDAVLALLALGVAPRAQAQQPKNIPTIGFLHPGFLERRPEVEGLYQGLRKLGYVEGQTIRIERRQAEGKFETLDQLANELVALKPALIIGGTTPAVRALQKATATIPIVMGFVSDPLGSGFTSSLGRPSGNITGCSNNVGESSRKRIQLLKELVPSLTRIAILWNSQASASVAMAQGAREAAATLGLQIESLEFKGPGELQAILRKKVDAKGLMVITDSVLTDHRAAVAEFAIAHRMASFGTYPDEVRLGFLASYGESLWNGFGRIAPYVDKILRGAKPAELPIEQPTKYDLVINLKTAKALGITIPQSVLLRVDEVIE